MKILILRFSSIGDIVLTTPVPRCIKAKYPDCSIHYATKRQYAGLLRGNPHIDQLHLLDGDLNELIRELKSQQFDLVIDLHRNLRTRLIRSALRVKSSCFDKLNWEKWLICILKVNILPYRHIVDRYLEAAADLHIANDGKGLDYFISPETSLSGFVLPEAYQVYALGAQHNTKKLPFDKQIELLSTLEGPVLLIGGKEDTNAGEALAQACPNAVNFCGKLSIDQSALLMQSARRVIAHDTGMMHIAAALGKPVVSVWGNTIPEFGMTPYYGHNAPALNQILEVKELSCRPCSKIGYSRCPRGHFKCMKQQDFSGISPLQS